MSKPENFIHEKDHVIAWNYMAQHRLGHRFLVIAPSKKALLEILAEGIPSVQSVPYPEWIRKVKVSKP